MDQGVLESLVDLTLPDLSRYLKQNRIPISLISTQWLLCLFINTVPIETVMRIWDAFFSEGAKACARFTYCLS